MATDDAEPADAEPADAEPADAEPADAEPADAEPAHDAERADGVGPRRRVRHPGRWVMAAALLVLLVGVAWVAITAVLARGQLADARTAVSQARRQILAGDLDAARNQVNGARRHAGRAHSLTTGPAWAITAHLPLVGPAATTVRGLTAGVDRIGSDVLPRLVDAATGVDPDTLVQPGGRINVAAVAAVEPQLSRAASTTASVRQDLSLLPDRTHVGAIDDGRDSAISELAELQKTLTDADLAVRVMPTLLGNQRPQRYFVGLLNSAESRGVGGLPGAFVILVADHGRLSITHFESDTRLTKVDSGVELGADYDRNYGQDEPTSTYINSTISPNFPDAARIWAGMWQRASGEHVDGAVALDPTALSYLLRATGPARTTTGQVVSADNVVDLTERTAYARYPDVDQRKAFLLQVARAVDEKIIATSGNPASLARAAGRAAVERRLLLWTSDTGIESQLADRPLSGVLPDDPDAFAAPIVVNAAGGKLDYYLDRRFSWTASGCGATRTVTATITLTNDVPAGTLPSYVTTRLDSHKGTAKPGDNRLLLRYYATTGARLAGVRIDGRPAGTQELSERGHPVFLFDLEIPRGASRTVTITLSEPDAGAPTVWRQPLVRPMDVTVKTPSCR